MIIMLDRRDFLKTLFYTGVLCSGGPLISSCSGIIRKDIHDYSRSKGYLNRPDIDVGAILYFASLAPSGHNTQPWRVRIKNSKTWVIEADPDRRLPMVDPENRELLLSLGAFTENLSLAAGTLGWRTDMDVIATGRFDRDVIRVNLHRDRPDDFNLEKIKKRRTIKNGLKPGEISLPDIQALKKQGDGNLAYFASGSKYASFLRDAAVENFRIQTLRDNAQQELVRWLRLDGISAKKYRDGLTAEGMEITGMKGWFVRHFVEPEDFLKKSYRKQSIDSISQQAGEGGGWIIITSQGETVSDLIDTGRRFQRMALTAYELGIGIHPMTQMLEEKKDLSGITTALENKSLPQFVLRAGYVDNYPEPVSLRRPVEWFTYSGEC